MGSSRTAVSARDVCKSFGDVQALDQVGLDVPRGEVHGLIGPNGAGKTTLLSMLLGLTTADSGELTVLGMPVRRVLGLPEGVSGFVDSPAMYPSLTARQNLVEMARLRGRRVNSSKEADGCLEEVGLAQVAGERVHGFSLGMRQRLGLAAAMILHPELLVLDEPSNGLDPAGRRDVHRVITGLADEGVAVIISSHQMDDVARQCSRVTVLSVGRVVFSGAIAELSRRITAADNRIVCTNPDGLRRIASTTWGITPGDSAENRKSDDGAVVVHGSGPALDRLVHRLVEAGIGIRELAPVVPPLEAAFLELTDQSADDAGLQEASR